MGTYFLKVLFAVLVCFCHTKLSILGFNSPSNVKCNEKERQALLNFKHGLRDDSGMLSTWKDNDNNSDCCRWEGIQCNNETGYVHMLQLRGRYPQYLKGAFNIASLLELQHMEYLDLSYNLFSSSQIPQHVGSFKSLRYLNLSYSNFGGKIPFELGNLSKLEYLDLKQTSLNGAIPSQLGKLTSLHYLDLSYNFDIYGEIPYQLGNLSQLRYLDLSGAALSGIIPFQVGNLPNLHTVKLASYVDLKFIDAKWLSSLSSLMTLDLSSWPNLVSSRQCIQMISEVIPNLRELRLAGCSLSDDNVSSLFPSHFNFFTSLSILDLSYNMLTSSTFQFLFKYSLNLQELYLSQNNIVLSSSHYPIFPSLVIFDLSFNNLASFLFQGYFNFSSKLRELHLTNCSLTDKNFLVPHASIKKSSSSLVTLDLANNLLKSSAIFHWIFNFTPELHSLYLDQNLLEGPIPDRFGKAMNSLQVLRLGSNKLEGKIPASLGNICTLQELHLYNNNLSGGISSFIQNTSWCNRHKFQSLNLSDHDPIIGMLHNHSILSSLRALDLSHNQFTGEIPKSIGLLHDLDYLYLNGNNLEGDITESHFINLSKLKLLDLSDNSLSLKVGTTWIPPFQLFRLGLASCKLGRGFPRWLHTQSQLEFLDISDAGIDDFVPEWFWNNLRSLCQMNMSCNSIKGTIPDLPIEFDGGNRNMVILSSNQLEGGIPTFLKQADSLDLSKNKITDLKTFLCEKNITTEMRTLDLSNNQLMGPLPDCWEHLTSLRYLDLSNNKLSGNIPKSLGTLVYLEDLVVRNNKLSGELPLTLKNCTSLIKLDASENLLSGPIPTWIGESLQQLRVLSLRVNHFFGSVPVHLCYLRQIHLLDLSRNHLSGRIPTCLRNFTAMNEIEVVTRTRAMFRKVSSAATTGEIYDSNVLLMWKGQEYVFLNPEYLLKSIDLSSNNLTGEIPKEVGYLLGLVSLNLSRNNLSGEIPSEIGNLNWLEFLDLSRNHLSGKIPSTLSKIDRLAVLDLSNNHLIGRIPWGRQLQTFDSSSFEGNIELCGEQLNKSCPGEKTVGKPEGPRIDGEDDDSVFLEALYTSSGLGFFAGFWVLLGSTLLWKPWRNAYLKFLDKLRDYIFVMVEEVNAARSH